MEILYKRSDGTFVAIVNGYPYHITENDTLFAEARVLGVNTPLDPQIPLLQPLPNRKLSFAQLLIGLVTEGWITESEGDAWLGRVLPPPVVQLIAAMNPSERFAARARALDPSVVLRDDPLLNSLAVAQNKSSADLDRFFVTYGSV